MSYRNLAGMHVARCNRCHGHIPAKWRKKSEHDDKHHQLDLATSMTADVIAEERGRRAKRLRDE